MADFGFWELALILFVALLVVGPERLPALASTLGLWLGRMRGLANQFKADFMNETRAGDLKKIMGDTRDTLGDAQRRINRELRDTDPLVRSIEDQIDSGRFAPAKTSDPDPDAEPNTEPDAGERAASRTANPDAATAANLDAATTANPDAATTANPDAGASPGVATTANPATGAAPDADENSDENPDAGDVRPDDRALGRD